MQVIQNTLRVLLQRIIAFGLGAFLFSFKRRRILISIFAWFGIAVGLGAVGLMVLEISSYPRH